MVHRNFPLKPADFVLIGFLIAVPLCFGFVAFLKEGFGPSPRFPHSVKIRVSGHPERNLEFSGNIQPGEVTVAGWIGNSTMEIGKDGSARFISSPCPNKVCVKDGWIGRSYSTIFASFSPPERGHPWTADGLSVSVCVPNGIILEVLGDSNLFDGVSR